MKKTIVTPLILLCILTALILLAWVLNKDRQKASVPHSEQPSAKVNERNIFDQWRASQPKHIVSATELMSKYVNDPYVSDIKYASQFEPFKIIAVTGTIRSIDRKETKDYINQFDYSITLDGGKVGKRPTYVECKFHYSQDYSLRALKKGDPVKIAGHILTGTHSDADGTRKRGGLRRRSNRFYQFLLQGEDRQYTTQSELRKLDAAGHLYYYVVMDGCRLVRE